MIALHFNPKNALPSVDGPEAVLLFTARVRRTPVMFDYSGDERTRCPLLRAADLEYLNERFQDG